MTFVVTMVGRNALYQSADFKLTNFVTGKAQVFPRFKHVPVQGSGWVGLVAFSGVGHTGKVSVSDWLSDGYNKVGGPSASFEEFLTFLESFSELLASVPAQQRRHTFSVAAYHHAEPVVALISNFERIGEKPRGSAADRMSRSLRGHGGSVIPSGSGARFLEAKDYQRLAGAMKREASHAEIQKILVELNLRISKSDPGVSAACATSYVERTHRGGTNTHGIPREMPLPFPMPGMPREALAAITALVGNGKFKGMTFGSTASSVAMVEAQLRARPMDAASHNEAAAFYWREEDFLSAEKMLRSSLAIERDQAQAEANLGAVLLKLGRIVEAKAAFERALACTNPPSRAFGALAECLDEQARDLRAVERILRQGIALHPDDSSLGLQLVEVLIESGRSAEAAPYAAHVLSKQPNNKPAMLAQAMTWVFARCDAQLDDAIVFLRIVRSSPELEVAAMVLLGQLLYQGDRQSEGNALLARAVAQATDESLSLIAWFLLFLHDGDNFPDAGDRVRSILDKGIRRLGWNLSRNVELAIAGHEDPTSVRSFARAIGSEA